MKEYIIAAEKFETVLGQCLSPLQGWSVVAWLPTAGAVGCILAPLRGWVRFFRRFAAGYGSAPLHGWARLFAGGFGTCQGRRLPFTALERNIQNCVR